MADKWTPETPWFGGDKQTKANWPTYVCRNPSCKNRGKAHPNCQCGAPSFSAQSRALEYAKGGEVHYCSLNQPHKMGCEHYADGGGVSAPESPTPLSFGESDDSATTLGHAAINGGLLRMLEGGFGSAILKNPDEAAKVIDQAKAQHRFRGLGKPADGMIEQGPKKDLGSSLGDSMFEGDHEASADLIKDHPLVGDVKKSALNTIMSRLSGPALQKDTNPEAFRGSVDYLDSAVRGGDAINKASGSIMEDGKPTTHLQESAREAAREELKQKLESIQVNPKQLLDVAGSLGHYMPEHAGQIGATVATATNYLNSIKPVKSQNAPLDPVSPPNTVAQDSYHRQLDIANHPMLVFDHIKNGTLQPQDVVTLGTIYPGLHKTMLKKAGEEIIKAKSEDRQIPYKQRMSLSLLLGQPLDSTLTQSSMSAIISSTMGQQAPQAQGKKSGPTAQTQKTIDKANSLYETPLDRLESKK